MAREKPEAPQFVSGPAEPESPVRVARPDLAPVRFLAAASSGDPEVQHLLVLLDAHLTAGNTAGADGVRERIKALGFNA